MTAATLLMLSATAQAAVKTLPELQAPAVYKGEYAHKKGVYRVTLLLEDAIFVLDEETTLSNGKKNTQQIRGKWHQIHDDALLQLTNRSGFYRRLNVGSAGNLYLGIPLASGKQGTVVLVQQQDAPPATYALEGTLRLTLGGAVVLDMLSGTEHLLQGNNLLATFVKTLDGGKGSAPFVHVVVRQERKGKNALRVLELQRIAVPASRFLQSTPNGFQDGVAGIYWRLIRLEQRKALDRSVLLFKPAQGQATGQLELREGASLVTGTYALHDEALTLKMKEGHASLSRMLRRVKSWRMYGEVLELWDDNRQVFLLEKVRPE